MHPANVTPQKTQSSPTIGNAAQVFFQDDKEDEGELHEGELRAAKITNAQKSLSKNLFYIAAFS